MRTLFPSLLLLLAACGDSSAAGKAASTIGPTVYVALDEQFSRPLLDRFGKELQLDVTQRHDTEASKTVGLVNALIEERNNPRATVFWCNESAQVAKLAQLGVLVPYASPAAADVPAEYKDPEGRWTGFAARARVLIVNTKLLPDPAGWPTSYRDLVDPKWKGKCAIAKPVRGTTLTHMTALRQQLGEQEFGAFVEAMIGNNVQFLGSNGATMREVRDGKLPWAFTDTDDYHVARLKGHKVACVFPDQHEGGIGTMLIPNAVGLVAGGPDQEGAKKLIDAILRRETEALLAAADGAQIPLRSGVQGPKDPAVKSLGAFKQMAWSVDQVAADLTRCDADFNKRWGQ